MIILKHKMLTKLIAGLLPLLIHQEILIASPIVVLVFVNIKYMCQYNHHRGCTVDISICQRQRHTRGVVHAVTRKTVVRKYNLKRLQHYNGRTQYQRTKAKHALF